MELTDSSDNIGLMEGGGSKYNKDTYIGYLKEKNGGMKIIRGKEDNKIINKRNKILNHLEKVLSGGKRLKENNIEKYFKALGGKYIRNDICMSSSTKNCKGGKNVSIGGADKLLKLIADKNLNVEKSIQKFKGAAPTLYEKIENKISRGGTNNISSENSYSSNRGNKYNARNYENNYNYNRGGYQNNNVSMYGGNILDNDLELNKLRMEIGRYQYLSGGNDN